tara:strand:- start:2003 stop:2413 length:411 start_codon:yes stop_codon:yes gene_type:complete
MAKLYYGKGDCTVEGNVGSLTIYYRGNIVIDSKLPDGYEIELEKRKLIINTSSRTHNLNELFRYLGEFKILSVTAKNLEGDKESVSIKRVMDYSELLDSNSEDLTVKSEDLKVTYLHGRKFKKTMLLPKSIKRDRI